MRWCLLVLVLILVSCSQPAGIGGEKNKTIDTEPMNKTEEEVVKATEPVNKTEIDTEREEEATDEEKANPIEEHPNRVDVKLGDGSAEVKGWFNNVHHEFDLPYDDKDAIIFDAADKWDVLLFDMRYAIYFDGNRHLRPSQVDSATEGIAQLKDGTLKVDYIEWVAEKDDGFIRKVGCDRNKGIIKFEVHNFMETDLPIWRDVKPRIKGSLVTRINKEIFDGISCEDNADPLLSNTTYTCWRSAVAFVEGRHSSLFNDDVDYGDLKNEIVLQIPGETDVFEFSCGDDPVEVNATDMNTTEDNSTNSTA